MSAHYPTLTILETVEVQNFLFILEQTEDLITPGTNGFKYKYLVVNGKM